MLTYVGGGCWRTGGGDVSLTRRCITQNVRSATMAEPSASVTSKIIGRMILVFFLVLGHCFTGCRGVTYDPALFTKSLDSDGNLNFIKQASEEAVDGYKFTPPDSLQREKHFVANTGLNDKIQRLNHSAQRRELSLRKLLENLTKLQKRNVAAKSNMNVADLSNKNARLAAESTNTPWGRSLYSETDFQTRLENSFISMSDVQSHTTPLRVIAQVDMIPSSDNYQSVNTVKPKQKHNRLETEYLSAFTEPATIEKSVSNEISSYFKNVDVDKVISKNRKEPNEINVENYGEDTNNEAVFLRNKNDGLVYLASPGSQGYGFQNQGSSHLLIQDKSHHLRHPDHNDESPHVVAVPHENIDVAPESHWIHHHVPEIRNSEQDHRDELKAGDRVSIDSLIYETVKKMEGIIKKQVTQSTDFFLVDSTQSSSGTLPRAQTFDTDQANTAESMKERDSVFLNTHGHDIPDNEDELAEEEELFSHEQPTPDQVNDVTAAVIKAVASRTVPKDAQFWKNVSAYLDSTDYLSRTRRSPDRSRKRNGGPRYVHLSITYGHVMPCEYKDRFYCMNGGTCVFVGALDIKTCRCPIGYTGVRCEMIDQEYILSLLTNTLIFS